jgi:pheromone shutdown-related protein TraB
MEVKVNDNITLIGTAHISEKSVEEVRAAIETYDPDIIGVELCQSRYDAITNKKTWEEMPVTRLLDGNNIYFLLANTFLGSIQRRLGHELGVEPGSEMISAINLAKERKKEIALLDRDISVTFKRLWAMMKFREKFRMLWELMKSVVGYEKEEEINLEDMMNEDAITLMMNELKEVAPSASTVLVEERDSCLATNIIRQSKKGKVLAVIGAGHLNGVRDAILSDKEIALEELESVPKKRISVGKVLTYAIPALLGALIIWLVFSGDFSKVVDIFFYWILITGSFSALGAVITLAHPYAIATAFIAAPLTTIHPLLAAGWFSGLVEAKMRTPTIKDFQNLRNIETLREFVKNKVMRVLLVAAITNVTASVGTIIALTYAIGIAL